MALISSLQDASSLPSVFGDCQALTVAVAAQFTKHLKFYLYPLQTKPENQDRQDELPWLLSSLGQMSLRKGWAHSERDR